MESGSPHTGPGGNDGTQDNVVRLPVDWLGPRDELVPITPRPEAPQPSPAADFWGDGSAAIQAPVIAAPKPGEAPSPDAADSSFVLGWAASLRAPDPPDQPAATGIMSGVGRLRLPQWALPEIRLRPNRSALMVICSGLVAMVGATLIVAGLVSGGAGRRPATESAQSVRPAARPAPIARATERVLPRTKPVKRHVAAPRHQSPRRHRPAGHLTASGHATSVSHPVTSTYSASAARTTMPAASQATHSYASQASYAPSHPAAPPAFGVGGALGPGSSANG